MRLIFCLVLPLLFTYLPAASQNARKMVTDVCSSFKVSVMTLQNPDTKVWEVRFAPEGGKQPYRYILYDKTGQLVSEAFLAGRYTDIKSGEYQCLAVDAGRCKQTLDLHLP